MTQHLSFPDRIDFIDSLELADHKVFDKNIELKRLFENQSVINNWYLELPAHRKSRFPKFVTKADLVHLFKQTGSEVFVNRVGCMNYVPGDSFFSL